MRMSALADFRMRPGWIHSWRMTDSALSAAHAAPAHPVGPSYNQETHLNKVRAQRAEGVLATRWLAVMVEMVGTINLDVLTSAFVELVRRHDTLRSGFRVTRQCIDRFMVPRSDVRLERVNMGVFKTSELVLDHLQQMFDNATDPLGWPAYSFVAVVRDDSFSVVMAFDHSHADLCSHAFVAHEIIELYVAGIEERRPRLSPAASYVEFCADERGGAERAGFDEAVQHWRRFIDVCGGTRPSSGLELGVGPGQVCQLACEEIPLLDDKLADMFEQWCTRHGGRISAGLLGAFGMAATQVRQLERFSTIMPFQTRRVLSQSSVGWYVNAAPIQFPVDPSGTSLQHVMREARLSLLSAKQHLLVPFDRLAGLLPASVMENERVSWLSFLDFRRFPGSERHEECNVHILADRRDGNEVDFWINRTHRGIGIYCRYPATAVAYRSVHTRVRLVREVIMVALLSTFTAAADRKVTG